MRRPKTNHWSWFQVMGKPLDHRKVLTIDPTHEAWSKGISISFKSLISDALVRLRPPPATEGERLLESVLKAVQGVAAGVNVYAREAVASAVSKASREIESVISRKHVFRGASAIRQVVFTMAENASTDDRPALNKCLEESLSHAGV